MPFCQSATLSAQGMTWWILQGYFPCFSCPAIYFIFKSPFIHSFTHSVAHLSIFRSKCPDTVVYSYCFVSNAHEFMWHCSSGISCHKLSVSSSLLHRAVVYVLSLVWRASVHEFSTVPCIVLRLGFQIWLQRAVCALAVSPVHSHCFVDGSPFTPSGLAGPLLNIHLTKSNLEKKEFIWLMVLRG